jgi:uncharacterized protein (UPF0303 family)
VTRDGLADWTGPREALADWTAALGHRPRAGRGTLPVMSNNWPTVTELAAQEAELQLDGFDEDQAWALGVALVEEARQRGAGVVVDVERAGRQLFHAALPGTAPDNDEWIRRKGNVVRRFGHSSLYVGQVCRDQGTTIEEKYAVPTADYAAHGGAFPLLVRGVGSVGVIAVSGLPQLEDHDLVVSVLRGQLGSR